MSVHEPLRPLATLLIILVAGAARAETAAGRLPAEVRPVFQSIRLDLDPASAEYTGSVRVELDVRTAVFSLSFHAEKMRLTSLALAGPGQATIDVTHDSDGVTTTVRAAAPLAPGRYVLEAAFASAFRTDGLGLYKVMAGGEAYLVTQFEADEARTAFPCWDEPAFKFPYQMTVTLPEGRTAVSNTPVESDTVASGRRTIVFKKTPPMPSYLLALAAGPLEFVPVPGTSVPTRVVTVKGAAGLAGEAARVTPPLLAALEKYFGRKYPYEKLDLIGVPEYWYGAMENPGAIVYRDQFLLLGPQASTVERQALIGITAHELAHMWFGDLVTMAWWDDLWLNEAFASWMGDKVTREVFPDLGVNTFFVQGVQSAMQTDARPSARAIRQPVTAADNIIAGADELAYQKGQAVLAMTEAWVGADAFRQGVLDYLAAHEWGNATAADLFGALGKASGKDVRAVLEGFIAQPGVPLVNVESVSGRKVTLAQQRFANEGAGVAPGRWSVPVTLRYEDADGVHTHAVLLGAPRATGELPGRGAVAWLYPKAGETGYYRWNLPAPMLRVLAGTAASKLTVGERVGLLGNLSALLDAGVIGGAHYVALLPALARDPDPDVVSAVVTSLAELKLGFLTPELEEPFAAYVRRTLAPPLERFGISRKEGEAQAVSPLRARLIGWLGADGQDAEVRARAAKWTQAWLADPLSVDPGVAGPALEVAAITGDRALFDAYRKRLETTQVPSERQQLVSALGHFRDPALVDAALAYALGDGLRPTEMFAVPAAVGTWVGNEERPYRFMEENFEAIKKRVPEAVLGYMPQFAFGCSAARLEKAKAFFAQPAHAAPGSDVQLAKVTEAVQDCVRLRAREGAAVGKSLRAMLAP